MLLSPKFLFWYLLMAFWYTYFTDSKQTRSRRKTFKRYLHDSTCTLSDKLCLIFPSVWECRWNLLRWFSPFPKMFLTEIDLYDSNYGSLSAKATSPHKALLGAVFILISFAKIFLKAYFFACQVFLSVMFALHLKIEYETGIKWKKKAKACITHIYRDYEATTPTLRYGFNKLFWWNR